MLGEGTQRVQVGYNPKTRAIGIRGASARGVEADLIDEPVASGHRAYEDRVGGVYLGAIPERPR